MYGGTTLLPKEWQQKNGKEISVWTARHFLSYVTTWVLVKKNKLHWRVRMPLSLEIAFTLYYLADERRMRKVANAFGIGKSTALKVVRPVTMAISSLFGPQYIKHP